MLRSVLLLSDQLAGRFPDRCVLSGERTDRAVRMTAVTWHHRPWLLGIPGLVALLCLRGGEHRFRASLPVSANVWRTWRRRELAATCLMAIGLGFALVAPVRHAVGLAVAGGAIAVIGAVIRTRAAYNYWFTCRLERDRGLIVVAPTHEKFDNEARTLFDRSLRGG